MLKNINIIESKNNECYQLSFIAFVKSSNVGEALTVLSQLSGKYLHIGTYYDPKEMYSLLNIARPKIVAMNLEWYLTYGITIMNRIRSIYDDIEILVNGHNARKDLIDKIGEVSAKNAVCIISIEQLLEILIDEQKGKFIISEDSISEIIQYYNLSDNNSELIGITPAEKNILTLLVNGQSYKLIAYNLNISIETVKTHIRNIYRKLEVNNISSAVAKAIKYSLV